VDTQPKWKPQWPVRLAENRRESHAGGTENETILDEDYSTHVCVPRKENCFVVGKRKRGFVIVSASGASQVVNQTDDQHDGVNQQQTTAAAISDEGRRLVENGRGGGDSVVAVATAGSLRQRSVDSPAE